MSEDSRRSNSSYISAPAPGPQKCQHVCDFFRYRLLRTATYRRYGILAITVRLGLRLTAESFESCTEVTCLCAFSVVDSPRRRAPRRPRAAPPAPPPLCCIVLAFVCTVRSSFWSFSPRRASSVSRRSKRRFFMAFKCIRIYISARYNDAHRAGRFNILAVSMAQVGSWCPGTGVAPGSATHAAHARARVRAACTLYSVWYKL